MDTGPAATDLRGRTPAGTKRFDIEGLRAIAVMYVVLFHLGVPGFGGGYSGVDIFFVISGFLITGQLMKEVDRRGTISLPSFYARRIRRLLPAATTVLVVCALLVATVFPSGLRAANALDIGAAGLSLINWVLAVRAVDYLAVDVDAIPSIVQHYWSLAVEEQFYLIWPALMLLSVVLARRLGLSWRAGLAGVFLLLFGASLAHSIIATDTMPQQAYFITTTRMWELVLGAMVAAGAGWLARHLGPALAQLAALVGAAGLVASAVLFAESTAWPGASALVPTVSVALVLAAGCADTSTWIARLLSMQPLQFLGALSYPLYLWHWPVFLTADLLFPGAPWWTSVLAALLAVALAWGTKVAVEDPLRHHRWLTTSVPRTLAMGAGAVTVSLVAAALLWNVRPVVGSVPLPDPTAGLQAPATAPGDRSGALALAMGPMAYVDPASAETPTLQQIAAPRLAWTTTGPIVPPAGAANDDVPRTYADNCQISARESEPATHCIYGKKDSPKTVVLWGDSKANQWFPALEAMALREGWRLEVQTMSTCAATTPIPEESTSKYAQCYQWARTVQEHLLRTKPAAIFYSHGRSLTAEQGSGVSTLFQPLKDAGISLFFLEDSMYRGTSNIERCLDRHAGNYLECGFARAAGAGSVSLQAAASTLGARYVTVNQWICPPASERCPYVVGGVLVYRQGSHVTATYAAWMAPYLHREAIAAKLATTSPMPVMGN